MASRRRERVLAGPVLLLLCLISTKQKAVAGLRNGDICIEKGPNERTACENIYVWERETADFVRASGGRRQSEEARNDLNALRGKTVRVVADNMLPYITSSNYSRKLGGYLGDIWHIIEKRLGFKNDITSVNYDTGVELMINKKADIMLAAAIEKPGQVNIQYSQPYFYNWYHLYIKQPEPKASSNSYIRIFKLNLWIAAISLILIMTITLWFSARCAHRVDRKQSRLSIITCMMVVCSGFLNQGVEVRITTYSARTQIFLGLVIGFLLYSAMNAVLVARLASFEVQLPFKDLNDIMHKKTHSLCLRTNSFVFNNFVYSNFTNDNKILLPEWHGILNGPGCLDINNQTNLAKILCNDGVIFLENRVVMATIIKTYDLPCTITFPPQKFFMKPNSFILLKGFQEKTLINSMVKKLKSTGILRRLENKWVERYEPPSANSGNVPQVTIEHISGLLDLYSVAICGSFIILAIEILRSKFARRNAIPFRH
ncbi:hypothetical protein Trydic_g5948 [Trypoxylus dichotomus]